LHAIYRVENARAQARHVTLFLAIRPFQVDPPWQSLNMVGGVSPIHTIRFDAGAVWLNRDKPVIFPDPPQSVGATSVEQGSLIDHLRAGKVPPERGASDRFGFASAAVGYELDVPPPVTRRSPSACRSTPATFSRRRPPTPRKTSATDSTRRAATGRAASSTSASRCRPTAIGWRAR